MVKVANVSLAGGGAQVTPSAKIAKACKSCKSLQKLQKTPKPPRGVFMAQQKIAPNPFTPTFGLIPPYMAGRETLMEEISAAFANGLGDPNLSTIISGARGSGKTAFISLMAQEAQAQGWISADVTAAPGMLEDILSQTTIAAANFLEATSQRKLKGVTIGQLVGIEWENQPPSTGNWRVQMTHILDQLAAQDIGLLITVDEVNVGLDEMKQLVRTYQHFVREGRKVGLLMAGLPFAVSSLLNDESVSFLRRARKHKLGRISDMEIADALKLTILEADRNIEPDALDAAVAATEGFPYMMQLVGYRIWAENPQNKTITAADAKRGIELAKQEMAEGILEYTFKELSAGDKRFLAAMLQDEKESTLADVARRMNVKSNYASQYKRRLLEQGVIGETPYGALRFDMPAFKEYLQANHLLDNLGQ
jgi:hypothetical protein